MSDKVFFGAVGGILVVVLVASYFLVWDNYDQYATKSSDLQSKVKKMEKLAKKPVDELPTAALLDAHEDRAEKWQQHHDEAVAFLEARDELFEAYIGGEQTPSLAVWEAAYRDAYKKLAEEYVKAVELAEDEDPENLPFAEFGDLEAGKLLDYQKEWRIQEALVRTVLKIPGSKVTRLKRGRTQDIDNALPLANFDRIRMEFSATMPGSKVPELLGDVLAHPAINFDIHRMVVKKDMNSLIQDVVLEIPKGQTPPGEPHVMVILMLDALDWKKAETES